MHGIDDIPYPGKAVMIGPKQNATIPDQQLTGVGVRRHRYSPLSWDAKLGIALIVLGFIALATMGTPTIASVMRLGWLLLICGIVEVAHGLRVHSPNEFLLHSVPGIAGAPVGLLISTHPEAGHTSWMLLFASYLTIIGLFEILSASRLRFPRWRWAIVAGAITLLLGTIPWIEWSWLDLWFIGLALGVSLVLRGTMFFARAYPVHRAAAQNDSQAQSITEQADISDSKTNNDAGNPSRSRISDFRNSNLSPTAFRR